MSLQKHHLKNGHKCKRKEQNEKKGDKLKNLSQYRPNHQKSSRNGSIALLPSDHSERNYALSIFSVSSSSKMVSQNDTMKQFSPKV